MIKRHTHSIVFEFKDKLTGLTIFKCTMPLNRRKFSISEWYKTMKVSCANGENIPVDSVKGSHAIIESKVFDRIVYEWPGGVCLDVPADITAYEYQIIIAQFNVLKMSARP